GDEAAEALEDPHAHHARVPLPERMHFTLRDPQPREAPPPPPGHDLAPARVRENALPRGGGGDPLEPLRGDDEPLADDPFERRDLLADRRLRVAELLGRLVERALLSDGFERGEMPHLDADPG